MSGILTAILEALLGSAAVQGAIIVMFVSLIGVLTHRMVWVKHVISIGIMAYEYAEEQGLLENLKAYEKFGPFMDKFIERYRADYGKEPTAKAKAIAVEAMEKKVAEEHLGK